MAVYDGYVVRPGICAPTSLWAGWAMTGMRRRISELMAGMGSDSELSDCEFFGDGSDSESDPESDPEDAAGFMHVPRLYRHVGRHAPVAAADECAARIVRRVPAGGGAGRDAMAEDYLWSVILGLGWSLRCDGDVDIIVARLRYTTEVDEDTRAEVQRFMDRVANDLQEGCPALAEKERGELLQIVALGPGWVQNAFDCPDTVPYLLSQAQECDIETLVDA